MNPSNLGFPCTLGDRITDSMTGVEGICAGFKVRSDGSKAVCLAWNAHGDPRYLWVSDTRVTAGRTPEQIAADVQRAQEEANRVAGAAAGTAAAAVAGNAAGRPLSEDEAMDARQPDAEAQPARGTRRRRPAAAAGEAEVQRREGEQR